MNHSQITIRYSKALFDLALEKKVLEEVKKDMDLIDQVCHENRPLKNMLQNPVISIARKQKVMHQIFGSKINNLTLSFINILARKRREHLIDGIAGAFVALYKEHMGIKTAFVTAAVEIGDEEKKAMIDILRKLTDKKIELIEKENPDLIGGFILNMDNYQIDQSISSKIKELKQDFEQNLYIKGF